MVKFAIDAVETRRQRNEFVNLPYRLYARRPHWVPPLRSEERKAVDVRNHPFYKHGELKLFLARNGSETVGRIAAIIDHLDPRRHGSFGFFECDNNPAAAAALIDAAKGWLADRGIHQMTGPLSPSINYVSGILVDGFDDPPCIGLAYNPPYYAELLTGAGLTPLKDLLALRIRREAFRGPKARRFERFAQNREGVRFRQVDMTQLEKEFDLAWKLYAQAWAGNWGFVPLSREEVQSIGRDLERFGDPRGVQFCEAGGQTVGMLLVIPDLNQALLRARGRLLPFGWWHISRIRHVATRARIFMLGMTPEWQNTGIAAGFCAMADLPGVDHYQELEASWILEDNQRAIRGLQSLGAEVYKRYRLYGAAL
jgi:hypothetical protein